MTDPGRHCSTPSPRQDAASTLHVRRLETRRLTTGTEIRDARALLHDIYHDELGWQPSTDNPSGLRYRTEAGRRVVWDHYLDQSVWFGLFDGGALVGCIRAVWPRSGRCEVESYHPLPADLASRTRFEANRLAIRPRYRGFPPAVPLLMRCIAAFALETRVEVCLGTGPSPSPGRMYERMGAIRREEVSFRYDPGDPDPVYLYVFPTQTAGPRTIRVADTIRRRFEGASRLGAHRADARTEQ